MSTPTNMLTSAVATFLDNSAHGEDNFLVRQLDDGGILDAVIDGVTGHGGEEASQSVVDALSQADIKSPEDIVKVLEEVNADLFMAGGGRFLMTTASVTLYRDGKLHVVSIGDSPIYLIGPNNLRQLSGRIGGFLHVGVAKAVGAAETLRFHRAEATIEPGDRLVLATDGVSDNLQAEELADIVRQSDTADKAAQQVSATVAARLEKGVSLQQFGARFRHDDRTAIIRFFSQA